MEMHTSFSLQTKGDQLENTGANGYMCWKLFISSTKFFIKSQTRLVYHLDLPGSTKFFVGEVNHSFTEALRLTLGHVKIP